MCTMSRLMTLRIRRTSLFDGLTNLLYLFGVLGDGSHHPMAATLFLDSLIKPHLKTELSKVHTAHPIQLYINIYDFFY